MGVCVLWLRSRIGAYLVVSCDSLQEAEVVTAVKFEKVPFLSWYRSEAL